MKKHILQNKSGVTVLEGVIALGLLAVITAGSFGVLLSVSRQATQPDIREEMILAVEKANDEIKAFLAFGETQAGADMGLKDKAKDYIPLVLRSSDEYGLCEDESYAQPFDPNYPFYDISCMLPPICDKSDTTNNYFRYKVSVDSQDATAGLGSTYEDNWEIPSVNRYTIRFDIKCNGYRL